jgi:ligand-binding sensor domain-containing protein/two-component sensor histidine kinase
MKFAKIIYLYILTGLFLIAATFCPAQDFPDLHFSHLTIKDGLSSDLVKSVFQDHRGIMWFCTEDAGFNRYDGNNVKVFKHIPGDSTTLPSNDVRFMAEDTQYKLWFGTNAGLYWFDPVKEKGKLVILNSKKNVTDVLAIKCDAKGFVFVNTTENVYEINSKTGAIIMYTYDFEENESFNQKKYYDILSTFYEDSKNQLWLGSFFIDREKKLIQQKAFSNDYFETQLIEDKNKKMWSISWNEGLREWDETLKKFITRYNPTNPVDKIHNAVSWNFKNEDYLFITVYPLGAILYNTHTKKYIEYKHTADESSITSSEDRWLCKDKDNRIWIGSSKGISILDPEMQKFKYRSLYEDIDKSSVERFGFARAFLETKDEFAISGSYQIGLFLYTKDWLFKEHLLSIPPNANSIHSQEITSIFREENGDIWYSTDNGLVKKSKGQFKTFLPDHLKNAPHSNEFFFRNILKRTDGKFWVRSLGRKLYVFDPIKEKFVKDYANEIAAGTNAMALDAQNNVWIATTNGLFWVDAKKDKVDNIHFPSQNKNYEKALNTLKFIHCDKDNNLWITSENGLIKLNATTKNYSYIQQKDGLPEENLLKIVEDNSGFLWINTSKGIIRYDKKQSFNYYTAANGLPFTYNDLRCAFAKLASGNILLGYTGGVVEFNPNDFSSIKKDVVAIILDVFIDNKLMPILSEKNKSITIQPNEGQIKIHFGLLNYTAPTFNKFYFYLEGIQNDWQETTDGNIVFYKLPPGKYTLHVKGTINNATGKSIEDTLLIIVKPHWYQTNWFKALMALLLLLIVIRIIYFRSRQIRKKEKIKNFYENKMIHLEMQSLRSQMNPHFMFNTLNSINSYIIQNKTTLASEYLTTFSKLMRSILDLSKQETVSLAKEIVALKMYLELEALRLENKFDYSISIAPNIDEDNIKIPSLIIQPFVENAIWHGLHNKDTKGNITIQAKETAERLLMITIEDDGIGRKAAAALKQEQVKHKSYGIDITMNRVKLLNSNNSVTFTDLYDEKNRATGTRVTILLNTLSKDAV